jgi:hypothetical protein
VGSGEESGSLFPGREGGVVVRGDDNGCWLALGFVTLVVGLIALGRLIFKFKSYVSIVKGHI